MRKILIALGLIMLGSTSMAVLETSYASAACPDGKILTLKPWYDGLVTDDCKLKTIAPTSEKRDSGSQVTINTFVWRVILNVVEDLLQLAGFVAVGFVIYGGFAYLTSDGASDKMASALKTIINAAVGLVVAIAAIGLVNLVASGAGI